MKALFKTALILILTILISGNFICAFAFSDVTSEHKNYEAIVLLSEKKIITGYDDNSFKPDNSVTRAELCVMFARAAGYKKYSGNFEAELPFTDVSKDYWAEDYIHYAYNNGIVNGMGDGTFLPAAGVTYEQAVKMLICFAGLEEKAEAYKSDDVWYSGYLQIAYDYGLTDNINTVISKQSTRADIVQLLYNAYQKNLIDFKDTSNNDSVNQGDNNKPEVNNPETNTGAENNQNAESENTGEIKRILVDAGHNYSGFDIGARNEDETVKEEVLTWQIADKLAKCLRESGFEVYVTRENETSNIGNTSEKDSLKARADMANELDVDLLVSIHCNTGGGTGVEVYCFNKESVGGVISEMVSKDISQATGLYNRGSKTAEFYVIKNTVMPAILVETGFLDSDADLKVLTSDDGQNKIAAAITNAIKKYNEDIKN